MTPAQVLDGLPREHMTSHSGSVRAGSVFVAYPGTTRDGREFIPQALSRGAGAVLWEREGFNWNEAWHAPNVAVSHLREHYSALAHSFYDAPTDRLPLIGVTGTNGKTSIAYWLACALESLGERCGLIGTLGSGFVGSLEESGNTTPDAARIAQTLRDQQRAGAGAAAMEVSSHALDQARVAGLRFQSAIFTNLTRDHLDYHGTLARYGEAKARLFAMLGLRYAIVNIDDPAHVQMRAAVRAETKVIRYGLCAGEVFAQQFTCSARGITLSAHTPWGEVTTRVPILGAFNVSNLLAVIAGLGSLGHTAAAIQKAIATLRPVPGRMQRVEGSAARGHVVVDYAHTPDALEKALATLRDLLPEGGRLRVIVGCGGDRDRGKRTLMAQAAVRLADNAVFTSDNPRSEDPQAILRDMQEGLTATNHSVIVDRRQAITQTLASSGPRDIVLIAGKGHEKTQEIAGQKFPFDDVAVARLAMALRSAC